MSQCKPITRRVILADTTRAHRHFATHRPPHLSSAEIRKFENTRESVMSWKHSLAFLTFFTWSPIVRDVPCSQSLHTNIGRKYYYESAEIDTKRQGVEIAEFISPLPFTTLFVNSLFNFATLWAIRPRPHSGQCDVKGRSNINITQKSYFWTTHPPNVTLYNISLTQIETTPHPEKWPNRKLASKTVTVTVAVRVNTAGGCEISFIPLRLGAVIPVNCWKIDAESLANAR